MTDMGQILRLTAETRDLERGEQRLDSIATTAERTEGRVDKSLAGIERSSASTAKAVRELAAIASRGFSELQRSGDGAARAQKKSFDQLRASIDPAFAASQRYAQVQREVAGYVEAGEASQRAANEVLKEAARRYMGVVPAAERAAEAQQRAANEAAEMRASYEATRAALDPLFASSKRYEAAQEQMTLAVKAGVVTQQEANRVLLLAEKQYLGTSRAMSGATGPARGFLGLFSKERSHDLRQIGFQISQIGQQGSITGNYLGAAALQAADIGAYFGIMGIAAGTAISVLGPMAISLFETGKEAETAEDKVAALSSAVDGLAKVSQASSADIEAYLNQSFGALSQQVQALIDDLKGAEYSVISTAIRKEVEQATVELNQLGGAFHVFWAEFNNPGSVDAVYLEQINEVIRQAGVAYPEFVKLESAVNSVFAAKNLDDFIAGLAASHSIAAEIGGPVGDSVKAALFAAAQNGDVLNRVLGAAAGTATQIANTDLSAGITPAVAAAMDLSAELGVSLQRALAISGALSSTPTHDVFDPRDPRNKGQEAHLERIRRQMEQITHHTSLAEKQVKKYGSSGAKAGKSATKGLDDAEKATRAAEKAAGDYADALENNVVNGVTSMTDAWGDFVTRGFDDFSSFKDAVIGSFKNMLSQMISIAARNKILVSLGLGGSVNVGSSVAGGTAGGGSGGGGLLGNGGGLLSGLLGGGGLVGSLAGGAGIGFSSLLSGGIGGYTAAVGAQASAALTGSLSAIGGLVGILGPLALGVSLLSKAFGRKHTASGIEGKLGPDGFDGRSYDFYKGGWLRSDKTKYKAAPESVQSMLDTAMGTFMGNLEQLVPTLGLSTKALDDFTGSYFKIDTHKRTPEQVLNVLNKEIEKASEKMAELVLGTDKYTRAGETSLAALTRLSTSLSSVNELSDLLGHRIWDISLASADAASNLVDLFGGLDAMTAATATYFQNFYTEEERIAATTRQLRGEFEKLGVTMPESRLGFRELVESIDTTTQKGQELYAGLLGLSGALSQVLPDVQNFTASMSGLLAGIGSEIRDQITIAQGMASDAKAASQLWYRTATTLRDFLSDLLNTDLTAASRAQTLNVNRNRFNIAAEMARGGDVEAARDIPELAKAYLQSVRETSATALDYRRVAASVQSQVQFLAGLSELEGANDDVLTSLYEQQIDVLTSLGNFLNLEGLTDNQVGQLTAGVQELVKDWDGTMTMFDGALAGIEEAIKTTEAFSYGALVKELNVAVNAVAGADLPGGVAALVRAGGNEIQVALDFVIRSDLAAPDKWLATNSLSEHVKTLNFVVGKKVSAPIKQLALLTTSDLRKNIRLFLRQDLDADTRTIALAGNSELSRVVNVALGNPDAEATKLALGNVQDYAVTVEASLSGKLPKSIRKLVIDGSGSYAAMVTASLENLGGNARRILLRQQGRYVANIAATIASSVTTAEKRLLLEANTAGVRAVTIAGSFAEDIPADQRKLLESEGTSVLRTIEMLVNPDGITPFGHLFLQQLAETGDVERTLAARIWPQDVTAVGNALLEQMAAGTGTVVRTVSGRFELGQLKGQRARVLNQLAAGAGAVDRTVTGRVTARNLKPRAKDLLALMSNRQAEFERTVSGRFAAGTIEGDAKALLGLMSQGRARFNRSVAAEFTFSDLAGQAKDVLGLMSGETMTFVRTVVGGFSFNGLEGQAKDLLKQLGATPGGSVLRNLIGSLSTNGVEGTGAVFLDQLKAGTGSITRTIKGIVDVAKLDAGQKALLAAIDGSSAGSITLGGNIRFTPEQAFQNWYASTTQATITKPMDALRDMLGQLRDAVDKDRIQRENVQKLAHAQTELSRAKSALEGRKAAAVDLIGQIEALEKQAGVRLVNGAKDATLQVNEAGLIDYAATNIVSGSWSNRALWDKRFWGDGGLEDKIGLRNKSIRKAEGWIENLEAQIAALNPFASSTGTSPAASARVAAPPAPVPAYRSAPVGSSIEAELKKEIAALRDEVARGNDERRQLLMSVNKHAKRSGDALQTFRREEGSLKVTQVTE